MRLFDLLDEDLLGEMIGQGFVRLQTHPDPDVTLAILNYSEKAAYDGVWNPVTLQCRGLIYDAATNEVVARPFPKFFNHGQPGAPELDLDAPAVVTEKMDGSLGILYPLPADGLYAVATRGSFASEQAIHATDVWIDRYQDVAEVRPGLTYLFEIVYPSNRIVCDYGELDDLVFLDAVDVETGESWGPPYAWPGPVVQTHAYRTLAEALAAEPRPGAEGFVVYLPESDVRVKLKQDEYVALHRILTGTNARHVWEYAAVRACRDLVAEPKHWGTYLGIDPVRAAELLAVGDDWLEQAGIPDEFYSWVQGVLDACEEQVGRDVVAGLRIAARAETIADRRERYEFVRANAGAYTTEVMRMATPTASVERLNELRLRAWREAQPAPTAPFARPEAIA